MNAPEHLQIALIGNPNCGKTTLFNALTGSRQHVGNWPGVTVTRKDGAYRHEGVSYNVVDLPGTYSLDVMDGGISLDEQVARDYVHTGEADLVVNIVDAANLERNLYLTLQLAEMGLPMLLALNMVDVAEAKGVRIDAERLAAELGCPVLPLVASRGNGVAELKTAIASAARQRRPASVRVDYAEPLEQAIATLAPALQADLASPPSGASRPGVVAPRWLLLRMLEGDALARRSVAPALAEQAAALAAGLGDDVDILVADGRYSKAHQVRSAVAHVAGHVGQDSTERIDRVVLHRLLGIPIFLLVMYLMFIFTIRIGGSFVEFFDKATGALLVDGLAHALTGWGWPGWVVQLLSKGVGDGVRVVATFIPIIACLYLFLSVLEDSGYMARAAFVMDRFMRAVGLPGKSFVPLIVGFGCNVPAIMATRTLEHHRDRLMTMAMAPFMSCGARLPVYVLFGAAFFPHSAQNVVFGLYLTGIVAAVLTGLALKNTLLQGASSPFIMELPPYHLPSVRGVLQLTWDKLKGFVVGAGRLIVPMVLVLNVLSSVGTDGSFGHENTDQSVLSAAGRALAPVFAPFGLTPDNWPATVGIFSGVLAKEAVVGTLNATYTALAASDAGTHAGAAGPEQAFALGPALRAAAATIPEKLAHALGLGAEAAPDEVTAGVFGAMVARFDGAAGALAYLLFVLLYFPCVATVGAIFQEAGGRWMGFVVLWTTGMAYGVATLFYQAATWARHPGGSALWVGAVLAGLALALGAMRRAGARQQPAAAPVARAA